MERVNSLVIEAPAAVAAAAAGLAAYGAGYPRAQLFGATVCRTNSARKLAITFDDGPNPAITPKLLDLLDRYKAKATFFLIGKYVRECPELVQETVARGHEVGNHTEAVATAEVELLTDDVGEKLTRLDRDVEVDRLLADLKSRRGLPEKIS